MEIKLILFGLPNFGTWTSEKEVGGITHQYSLLSGPYLCKSPSLSSTETVVMLWESFFLLFLFFFCLHRIINNVIILDINEEMEISSQLSPWNK